jgi:hypothetical protein
MSSTTLTLWCGGRTKDLPILKISKRLEMFYMKILTFSIFYLSLTCRSGTIHISFKLRQ